MLRYELRIFIKHKTMKTPLSNEKTHCRNHQYQNQDSYRHRHQNGDIDSLFSTF